MAEVPFAYPIRVGAIHNQQPAHNACCTSRQYGHTYSSQPPQGREHREKLTILASAHHTTQLALHHTDSNKGLRTGATGLQRTPTSSPRGHTCPHDAPPAHLPQHHEQQVGLQVLPVLLPHHVLHVRLQIPLRLVLKVARQGIRHFGDLDLLVAQQLHVLVTQHLTGNVGCGHSQWGSAGGANYGVCQLRWCGH